MRVSSGCYSAKYPVGHRFLTILLPCSSTLSEDFVFKELSERDVWEQIGSLGPRGKAAAETDGWASCAGQPKQ